MKLEKARRRNNAWNIYQAAGTTTATVAPTEPTGTNIVSITGRPGATFNDKLNSIATTQLLSMPAGTYSFNDFDAAEIYGARSNAKGLLGTGVAHTTVQMEPFTSTATDVPHGSPGDETNPYHLLQFYRSDDVKIDGFHLKGTQQGHMYGGMRVDYCNRPVLSNMKISAIPGDAQDPPGETFAANIFQSTAPVFDTIEIDGARIMSSGLATNSVSGGITLNRIYGHDVEYTKVWAGWQTSGGGTFTDCISVNNVFAWGFERMTGHYTFYRPVFGANVWDFHIGNDGYSTPCTIDIHDPVLLNGQQKILVYRPTNHLGKTNTQPLNTFRVFENGVDVTSSRITYTTAWLATNQGTYKGTRIPYTPPAWANWS